MFGPSILIMLFFNFILFYYHSIRVEEETAWYSVYVYHFVVSVVSIDCDNYEGRFLCS